MGDYLSLSDEDFYLFCKKYARVRGWKSIADDFAAEAFLMRKKWPGSSCRKYWAHYWRSQMGNEGSHKRKVEAAIHFRKTETSQGNILEDTLGVEIDPIRYEYLNAEQKGMVILLQHGFTFNDLQDLMKLTRSELIEKFEKMAASEIEKKQEISKVSRKPSALKVQALPLPKPSSLDAAQKALKDKKALLDRRSFLVF